MNFNKDIKDLTNAELIDMFEAYLNTSVGDNTGTILRNERPSEFGKQLYRWLFEELHG